MDNEANKITARFKEIVRQLCGGPQQVSSKTNVATATQLHEREESMTVALLAVLAGQNVFLIGPPGTAKSLMARRISNAFKEARYFEYLMQKFSTPEEIFGPIDIGKLKQGAYYRNTAGYLPQADFAFLDEIWKSNPPILNTLLTITNERKFRNGDGLEDVPLKALIGASNETPPKGEGLEALWDRFVVRLYIGRLESHDHFMSMLQESQVVPDVKVSPELSISTKEWKQWLTKIGQVKLSEETIQAITLIKAELVKMERENQERIGSEQDNAKREWQALEFYVSDRRWQRAVMLLKSSAFFSGRDTTNHLDTMLLRHCLWNSSDNNDNTDRKKCTRDVIESIVTSHVGLSLVPNMDFSVIDRHLNEAEASLNADETANNLNKATAAISEMQVKIDSYHEELELYLQDALVRDDADKFRIVIRSAKEQISSLQERSHRLQTKPATPSAPETFKCPITDMDFVLVRGGTFRMGDHFGLGEVHERPVHDVHLDDFYLSKHVVSLKIWNKVMKKINAKNIPSWSTENMPVEASWDESQEFMQELSKRTSLCERYRLPTEAEWEYAACSGGKVELYSGGDNPDEVAWYRNKSECARPVREIAQKKPNGLGIYDMSGLAYEWCSDWFDDHYYSTSPIDNPQGPESGTWRVMRGGYYNGEMEQIRVSHRNSYLPNYMTCSVGFRLAMSAN